MLEDEYPPPPPPPPALEALNLVFELPPPPPPPQACTRTVVTPAGGVKEYVPGVLYVAGESMIPIADFNLTSGSVAGSVWGCELEFSVSTKIRCFAVPTLPKISLIW